MNNENEPTVQPIETKDLHDNPANPRAAAAPPPATCALCGARIADAAGYFYATAAHHETLPAGFCSAEHKQQFEKESRALWVSMRNAPDCQPPDRFCADCIDFNRKLYSEEAAAEDRRRMELPTRIPFKITEPMVKLILRATFGRLENAIAAGTPFTIAEIDTFSEFVYTRIRLLEQDAEMRICKMIEGAQDLIIERQLQFIKQRKLDQTVTTAPDAPKNQPETTTKPAQADLLSRLKRAIENGTLGRANTGVTIAKTPSDAPPAEESAAEMPDGIFNIERDLFRHGHLRELRDRLKDGDFYRLEATSFFVPADFFWNLKQRVEQGEIRMPDTPAQFYNALSDYAERKNTVYHDPDGKDTARMLKSLLSHATRFEISQTGKEEVKMHIETEAGEFGTKFDPSKVKPSPEKAAPEQNETETEPLNTPEIDTDPETMEKPDANIDRHKNMSAFTDREDDGDPFASRYSKADQQEDER